ncbi:hypothetical protein F4823DRAFT_612768 [Ustulina deusta]|nr:hypothetical protein F4823DRAFT_612768 [Ustulina deusta]
MQGLCSSRRRRPRRRRRKKRRNGGIISKIIPSALSLLRNTYWLMLFPSGRRMAPSALLPALWFSLINACMCPYVSLYLAYLSALHLNYS